MSLLQNIMERLRPIVGVKSWDYCVLWKLSEDQRFLEWMDCCCGGIENFQNSGEELLFPVPSVLPCRDVMFQHLRTKACELLAQLPSSMPLNAEIHAQALISNQPRWLNFSNGSNSNSSDETFGTRVLIPVPVGLIELFVDRQVSEDQRMIDFIISQFNLSLEQQHIIDTSTADSNFIVNINPIKENDQKDSDDLFQPPFSPATMMENLNLQDISLNQNRSCSFPMNFLQQFNYQTENIGTKNDEIFLENTNESSFHVENPMNPFKSSAENGFHEEIEVNNNSGNMHMNNMEPLVNKKRQGNDKDSMNRSDSVSDCSDPNDEEDDAKYRRRNGKGPQSKNLVAERKRRKKLNDRLYSLRALVPKISKLDRASILGDAIEFVMELQQQARDLQNELEDQHSDDEGGIGINNLSNLQPELLHGNGEFSNVIAHMGASILTCGGGIDISKQNQDPEITSETEKVQMEPQVEVAQLDGNEFFVKVFSEQKPGGFVKLMEALNSLGLEVTNVNVTSYRRLILNVFKVEKRDSEMVQADHVRDSLLELTRNPSRGWPEMAKASENGIDIDHHHHHRHHHPHLHTHQMKTQLHHHHHLHHIHN